MLTESKRNMPSRVVAVITSPHGYTGRGTSIVYNAAVQELFDLNFVPRFLASNFLMPCAKVKLTSTVTTNIAGVNLTLASDGSEV